MFKLLLKYVPYLLLCISLSHGFVNIPTTYHKNNVIKTYLKTSGHSDTNSVKNQDLFDLNRSFENSKKLSIVNSEKNEFTYLGLEYRKFIKF